MNIHRPQAQKTLQHKRSFSLIEVILAVILVGIALGPLLHDEVLRVRQYIRLNQKLTSERICEEIIMRELSVLATSNEYTLPMILNGITKTEMITKTLQASIYIEAIGTSSQTVENAPSFCLAKLTVVIDSPYRVPAQREKANKDEEDRRGITSRSVTLSIHEKKGG
jgi:type II secretory pathway pseudopilin PulG